MAFSFKPFHQNYSIITSVYGILSLSAQQMLGLSPKVTFGRYVTQDKPLANVLDEYPSISTLISSDGHTPYALLSILAVSQTYGNTGQDIFETASTLIKKPKSDVVWRL